MATKKLVKVKAKTATAKKTVKRVVRRVKTEVPALKPCKRTFTQTDINAMLATAAGIEVKQVKAVLGKLQNLVMASLMKPGVGKVKVLGLTLVAKHIAPQKMLAVKKGTEVKGFGGTTVISPGKAAYVKPARFRMRVRPLKAFKETVLS
jgi:hypothetical protein